MKHVIVCTWVLYCFTSCLKDKIEDPNEEELITTVGVTLTDQKTQQPFTFLFRDLDGPGGLPPQQFDTIKLNANSIYDAQIILGNESVAPAENIRNEVESESNDHQVFYLPNGIELQVSQLNKDANGWDLGTASKWNTGSSGKGNIRITLKHKPGFKSSNDGVEIGETDVEIDFPVSLQ
ncbi:MAG: hypothetical protein ACO29O_06330 [Chitinophagaceae bacterium]